jgi:phospholipase A1
VVASGEFDWSDETMMWIDTARNELLKNGRSLVVAFFVMVTVPVLAQDITEENVPVTGSAPVEKAPSAIDKRLRLEKDVDNNPFGLVPHKPNYLLPITYNSSPNDKPFTDEKNSLDNEEMKFQLSLKVLAIKGVFDRYSSLSFAYTNQSYFQIYNRSSSAPFRETNHEPEMMLSYLKPFNIGSVNFKVNTLGLSHQSNGQSTERSRSWNRAYLMMTGEVDETYFIFKPWYRLPESKKSDAGDPNGDDNPDIEFYTGNFEFQMLRYIGNKSLGITFRNNLRSENRGAVQIDWTFPIGKRLKGYVQAFNGYGESLIDYNDSTTRIGLGLMLTDWL